MSNALTWANLDDIFAFALYEKFPEQDPTHVRFTDLLRVGSRELEDFEDDPMKSNEAKLERVQVWHGWKNIQNGQ